MILHWFSFTRYSVCIQGFFLELKHCVNDFQGMIRYTQYLDVQIDTSKMSS